MAMPYHPNYRTNHYNVTFFQHTISTTVTNTPSSVDTWIADTERIHHYHPLIVGLDVEWRPNQIPNVKNPVATLQLCVERRCLIFQILQAPSIPQSLVNFLGNRSYTFTGVGIRNDVDKLREDYNLVVLRTADLRTLAADAFGVRELNNAGIKELTSRVLGVEMNKPMSITMSRWDDQLLTQAQVQYACIDAFLSSEIGKILISGNHNFWGF
ncbi:hypothetical protein R6Q59_000073 [Mikania micrantha]